MIGKLERVTNLVRAAKKPAPTYSELVVAFDAARALGIHIPDGLTSMVVTKRFEYFLANNDIDQACRVLLLSDSSDPQGLGSIQNSTLRSGTCHALVIKFMPKAFPTKLPAGADVDQEILRAKTIMAPLFGILGKLDHLLEEDRRAGGSSDKGNSAVIHPLCLSPGSCAFVFGLCFRTSLNIDLMLRFCIGCVSSLGQCGAIAAC